MVHIIILEIFPYSVVLLHYKNGTHATVHAPLKKH